MLRSFGSNCPNSPKARFCWNLRAAINVAALQCQFEPTLLSVSNYNAMIAHHDAELDAAQATLIKDLGLEGAAAPKSADRGVSLWMGERADAVRAAHGLCTDRFEADLETLGLELAAIPPGTILEIGPCRLIITRAGKGCFDQCPLYRAGTPCPLPKSAAFARVERGGPIAVGTEIRLLTGREA